MPSQFTMSDVIVVLPGIMGSTLVDRNGAELWGTKPGTILRMIASLGHQAARLKLPDGLGEEEPNDGIRADAVIKVPHFISKLFGADGYDGLLDWLKNNFDLHSPTGDTAGNLIVFPYDWRLSNRSNARRLGASALPALERWRAGGHPDAKLRFICHSMGGLVARWFVEKCGGREFTRQLITLGTPYSGSIEALVRLANGFDPKFGPLRLHLTDIVRSLPSAYQLLPTYRCLVKPFGRVTIGSGQVTNLDAAMVADAIAFHDDTLAAARTSGSSYGKFALTGTAQPTSLTAVLAGSFVESRRDIDGLDLGGDGTVPRLSSYPPEWSDDSAACAFPQQHAVLQSDYNLAFQLKQILTADAVAELAAPLRQIGLDVPEVVTAGEELLVRAQAGDGDPSLPLQAELRDEQGKSLGPRRTLVSHNDGNYSTTFAAVGPGLVKITLASSARGFPLAPVTGTTLVWDAASAGISA